jgi:hypothetical protein
MLPVVRLVAPALAIVIAGCSAVEFGYYREGIGSDLYREELPEVTRLQDEYVDIICRQANLAPPGLAPQERCVLPTVSRDWALLVQAGMNDIDRRCDHFLNWVDYHRRNDKHITKQVGDTVAAVTTIARVTGSPDRSLDVLAAALGLASNTFANTTARLLTVASQATVQSVVVVNQNKYRFALTREIIDNRPAAIHALRSYLRICMPATIETEINTNTIVAQRTGASGIAAIQQAPLSNTATVNPPLRARDPVRPPDRPQLAVIPAFNDIVLNYNPNVHRPAIVRSALLALCLPERDVETASSARGRALINIFEQHVYEFETNRTRADGLLDVGEMDTLRQRGRCDLSRFRNYYELIAFGKSAAPLIRQLNATKIGDPLPETTSLAGARDRILQLRQKLGLEIKIDGLRDQVTPDFRAALEKARVP